MPLPDRTAWTDERIDEKMVAVDRSIDDLRAEMRARFDAVDARFNAIDARFNAIDGRLDAIDARLDRILDRLVQIGFGLAAAMFIQIIVLVVAR